VSAGRFTPSSRLVAAIRRERSPDPDRPADFLDRIYASYADLDPAARDVAVARDVVMLHLGSQSNLYAALAWTFVNVIQRPAVVERVRPATTPSWSSARTSRSGSRSARSRSDRSSSRSRSSTSEATYRLGPGVLLTTMLSVNNTAAAPGLDGFDPAHYEGRRLVVPLPAKELVSTFGSWQPCLPGAALRDLGHSHRRPPAPRALRRRARVHGRGAAPGADRRGRPRRAAVHRPLPRKDVRLG
jgi:hypothetical protein